MLVVLMVEVGAGVKQEMMLINSRVLMVLQHQRRHRLKAATLHPPPPRPLPRHHQLQPQQHLWYQHRLRLPICRSMYAAPTASSLRRRTRIRDGSKSSPNRMQIRVFLRFEFFSLNFDDFYHQLNYILLFLNLCLSGAVPFSFTVRTNV